MDKIDFLKEKEELKTLAGKSALFKAVPQNLEKFEKEVDHIEQSTGGEKVISYLLNLFNEANTQTTAAISTLRSALSV